MVKKIVNRVLVSIPVLIGVIFLIFLMLNVAVSYTHLDVYKRQAFRSLPIIGLMFACAMQTSTMV